MTDTRAELVVPFTNDPSSVARAREHARRVIEDIVPTLVDDAELIVSELATNAMLHAVPPYELRVERAGGGVRVEVCDSSPDRTPATSGTGLAEVLALDFGEPDDDALLAAETMTGRGMLVVRSVATAWGVTVAGDHKRVWAEVGTVRRGRVMPVSDSTDGRADEAEGGNVRLAAVPARLVLESAANLDDVVREFRFAADAVEVLADAAAEFLAMTAPAREPLRVAARSAIEAGERLFTVSFHADESTVANLRRFLEIVESIAEHCGHGELLSLAPSAPVVEYRRWYVAEIARQVAGGEARPAPFPAVDMGDAEVVAARAAADASVSDTDPLPTFDLRRAEAEIEARSDVAGIGSAVFDALSTAVAASNASLCVAEWGAERVSIVWAQGYPADVIARWGTFGLLDDLPASEVVRTGRPVFFRTERERNARFPVFASAPVVGNEAIAILPVARGAALVIQFSEQRGFSPAVQSVLTAIADAAGRALIRIGAL